MSITGTGTGLGTAGAFVTVAPGLAASAFTGAHTMAALCRTSGPNVGMLGAYSAAISGNPDVAALHVNSGALFGLDDFSVGYGSGLGTADIWRWYVLSKPAGSVHFRYHYADLATLTWSHGEPANAGNHGNKPAAANLVLGMAYTNLQVNVSHLAAVAVWNSELSDSAIQAACTKLATNLASSSPVAGWLLKQSAVGSANSIVDFTGNGANENARQQIATSADPTDFDFALAAPAQGSANFAMNVGVAAAGRRASLGAAAFSETLALAASGVTARRGSAALGLAVSLAAGGGDPATIPRAKSEAGLIADYAVGLGSDYEVGIAWNPS